MTQEEDRNLEAANRLYALTGAGDWDGAAKMLTDDFFVTESTSVPFVGVYRGNRALEELFTKVMGMMDATGFDIQQMLAGGPWVISMLDILARDSDGSEIRIPVAEAFRFRDGLCCEIRPYYFDANLAIRAVEAKKATA